MIILLYGANMRKIRLLILSFLTISFFIFSNNSFADEQIITFKVGGMYCSACPAMVKKALIEDTFKLNMPNDKEYIKSIQLDFKNIVNGKNGNKYLKKFLL